MKDILNYYLLITALLLSFLHGFSQEQPVSNTPPPQPPTNKEMIQGNDPDGHRPGRPDGNNRNKENKKPIFIVKRLRLTPDESAKFLPLYQKYEQELMQLKMQSRVPLMKAMKDERDSVETPLKEQNKLIDNEMLLKQQEIELSKKYNEEYKKIMPPLKVAELYHAEEMFIENQLNANMRMEERNNRRNINQPPRSFPTAPVK